MTPRGLRRFAVFGFATTHDALAAEQVLKEYGVEVVPIPAPKTLGDLCGIALRVPADLQDGARAVLEAASVHPASEAAMEDV